MQLPFFQMSLATPDGKLLERQQKTAPNTGRTGTGTLLYGPSTAMGFRTPLSRLPKDAAVYFKLTHYKQDKKKNSVMAWSFAPVSMIKTGKFSLPLFEKPGGARRGPRGRARAPFLRRLLHSVCFVCAGFSTVLAQRCHPQFGGDGVSTLVELGLGGDRCTSLWRRIRIARRGGCM